MFDIKYIFLRHGYGHSGHQWPTDHIISHTCQCIVCGWIFATFIRAQKKAVVTAVHTLWFPVYCVHHIGHFVFHLLFAQGGSFTAPYFTSCGHLCSPIYASMLKRNLFVLFVCFCFSLYHCMPANFLWYSNNIKHIILDCCHMFLSHLHR